MFFSEIERWLMLFFYAAQRNGQIQISEIHIKPANYNFAPFLHFAVLCLQQANTSSHLLSANRMHPIFTLPLIHSDSTLPQSKWLWLMAGFQTNNHVVFSLQVFCIMETSPGLSVKQRPGPWGTLLTKLSMRSHRTPYSHWQVAFAGTRLVSSFQCWYL